MKLCVETSTTFEEWIRQSEQDYKDMLVYLKENDFKKVGELTEKNALAMHATTKTATPSFSYLLKILMINLSKEPFTFNDGERIAQMVVARHEVVEWELVTELNENTARGTGGFGHTGRD